MLEDEAEEPVVAAAAHEVLIDDGVRSLNTDFQDNRPANVPIAPPPAAGSR